MKRNVIAIAALALAISACSTTPKVEAQAPQLTPNQATLVTVPGWYKAQPKNTDTELYAVGTARSNDLSMVEHKAVLDAQSKLAFKLGGEVSALTKDYKSDVNGVYDQKTEQSTQRFANDVKMSGYTIIERIVVTEGTGFRSYVLLKFPLGGANIVARDNLRRDLAEETDRANAMHQELTKAKEAKRTKVAPSGAIVGKVRPAPVVIEQSGDLVVKITPADEEEED